jgi:hypothetical protein
MLVRVTGKEAHEERASRFGDVAKQWASLRRGKKRRTASWGLCILLDWSKVKSERSNGVSRSSEGCEEAASRLQLCLEGKAGLGRVKV